MNIKYIAVGFAIIWGLAGAAGSVDAGEHKFKATLSGTRMRTPTDTNGDGPAAGLLASLSITEGKSTFGRLTLQEVSDFIPSGPCTLPDGTPGFAVELLSPIPGTESRWTGAFRFRKTGELLTFDQVSGLVCINLGTFEFTVEQLYEISGGTGKFENAEGNLTVHGQGRVLNFDATGEAVFSIISNAEIEGTIIFDNGWRR
jgi:hypothetical protein